MTLLMQEYHQRLSLQLRILRTIRTTIEHRAIRLCDDRSRPPAPSCRHCDKSERGAARPATRWDECYLPVYLFQLTSSLAVCSLSQQQTSYQHRWLLLSVAFTRRHVVSVSASAFRLRTCVDVIYNTQPLAAALLDRHSPGSAAVRVDLPHSLHVCALFYPLSLTPSYP